LLHKMFIIDLNDMSHQNVLFQLTKNYSSNSLIFENAGNNKISKLHYNNNIVKHFLGCKLHYTKNLT